MPKTTVLDLLLNRLETSDDPDASGCGCGVSTDTLRTFEGSDLAPDDLAAHQRGELTIAELAATVDADLDPASIDDLDSLADQLDGPSSAAGSE